MSVISSVGGGKKYRSLEAQALAQAKFAHAQGLARANMGGPGGAGGGADEDQSNHQSNPLNLVRRAATPGGALESDSRFTGETPPHDTPPHDTSSHHTLSYPILS